MEYPLAPPSATAQEPFLRLLRDMGMQVQELKFASLQAALSPKGNRREIYVMELALQRKVGAVYTS